jgi:hypothetical protein
MWMRSCAVCKALLQKLRLCDSVRCQCGWEWHGCADEQIETKFRKEDCQVAKIMEFYVPASFRKNGKWISAQGRGKVIEFALAAKKSA